MTGEEVPLRRIRRPGLLVLLCLLVVSALVASFVVGRFVATPQRDEIEQASEPIPVTATVEERVIDARTEFVGTMQAGATAGLFPVNLPTRAVVTRQDLSPGSSVTRGTLLGAVAGQPVFSLAGPLPLYRDLRLNDRGDDVLAIQRSLIDAGFTTQPSGVVDSRTIAAAQRLFATVGLNLPAEEVIADPNPMPTQQAFIPFASFLPVPVLPATIVAAAPVGEVVSDELPLIQIQLANPTITFRATADAPETIAIGASVSIQAGASSFSGTVQSIGDFSNGSDGTVPGRDVVVQPQDEALGAIAVGATVVVRDEAQSQTSIAVPLVAVRQDAEGDYVRREVTQDGEQTFERVAITVGLVGGGWVAIDDGSVAVGDEVLVS